MCQTVNYYITQNASHLFFTNLPQGPETLTSILTVIWVPIPYRAGVVTMPNLP